MSSAEPFPLFYPSDARRPFESDATARRFAQVAGLGSDSRVLELGCGRGTASVVLARELGCDVVAADSDERSLAQLTDRLRSLSLQDRVSVRRVEAGQLPFSAGEFDAVIVAGRVPFRLADALHRLRPFLARDGRLCLTYPVRVGRAPARSAVEAWEAYLKEPLLLPRESLAAFALAGFEPETVETVSEEELTDLYRDLEAKLVLLPPDQRERGSWLQQELELFRAQPSKASVTYALLIGRRRETGERPPTSRDRG